MGSGKVSGNRVHRNPNDFSKSLGPNQTTKQKRSKNDKSKKNQKTGKTINKTEINDEGYPATASEQLSFLLGQYQSANGIQLSSLELDSIKDTCILETSPTLSQDVMNLGAHLKAAFGKQWKEVLCEGQLVDGKIDPGSPAALFISTSALRSIELLKGTRKLTSECYAAKLFSKHMKVEEQVVSFQEQFIIDLSKVVWEVMIRYQVVKGTCNADRIYLHVVSFQEQFIIDLSKVVWEVMIRYQIVKGTCNADRIYLHVVSFQEQFIIDLSKVVWEVMIRYQVVKGTCNADRIYLHVVSFQEQFIIDLSKVVWEVMIRYQVVKGTCNADRIYLHVVSFQEHFISDLSKVVWEVMIRYQFVKGRCNADQIYLHEAVLKGRVNIASGTPSRIKKLIDIEALGLSRLKVIVLDMYTDVKGYSLFSLPQVRDEFWDLYKNYIHPRLVEGEMRICLYGPLKTAIKFNDKKKAAKNT